MQKEINDALYATAYVSVREAAAILGVSTDCVYDMVRSGDLPCVRAGRRIRIPAAAFASAPPSDAPNHARARADSNVQLSAPGTAADEPDDGRSTLELTLGELIRRKRRGLGLNQHEVGLLFGVTQSTVARWERNDTSTIENLVAISDWLGIQVDEAARRMPRRGRRRPARDTLEVGATSGSADLRAAASALRDAAQLLDRLAN